jgi:hypothetical protein
MLSGEVDFYPQKMTLYIISILNIILDIGAKNSRWKKGASENKIEMLYFFVDYR